MNQVGFFTVFFSVLVFAACDERLVEEGAQDEFNVAYRKMDVVSQATGEHFPMALVYPTKAPSEHVSFGPFEMELSIGGETAAGKFPLAIISHGSGGSSLGHRSIAFALVRAGFVVGMPLHPNNNYKNNEAEGHLSNWTNRPLHISASIDMILSDREMSAHIDANKIAVIGHSAGGYTALAVAGGVADTQHIIELCHANPQINNPLCGLGNDVEIEAAQIKNARDERVKAIVMMAPVGILFTSKDSLAKVDIPALLLTPEKDAELTEPYHSDMIYRNYKNQALLTVCTISNAGHFSFITPPPKVLETKLGVIAADPTAFDRIAFHETLGVDIASYLEGVLNGEYNKNHLPTSCAGI